MAVLTLTAGLVVGTVAAAHGTSSPEPTTTPDPDVQEENGTDSPTEDPTETYGTSTATETAEPTPEPTTAPDPSPTDGETGEPTSSPTPTPDETSPEPTPEPTTSPDPTTSPTSPEPSDPPPSTPGPTSPSPSPPAEEDPNTEDDPTTAPEPTVSCQGTTMVYPGETVTVRCSASGAEGFRLGTTVSQIGGSISHQSNTLTYSAPQDAETTLTDLFTVVALDAQGQEIATTRVQFTIYGAPGGSSSHQPPVASEQTTDPSLTSPPSQDGAGETSPSQGHPRLPMPGFPRNGPLDQATGQNSSPGEDADPAYDASTPEPEAGGSASGGTGAGAALAQTGPGALAWTGALALCAVSLGVGAMLTTRRTAARCAPATKASGRYED